MKDVYGLRKRRSAQTLVFFLLAWGTIMLLCGLAIDSGLLFLAKARMGRAVDGAALAAVGNFNRNSATPALNRDAVALIMRNFAVANFTDLSPIAATVAASGTPSGGTPHSYTLPNGTTATTYSYSFNDGNQDANGAYKRFVDVTLNTGSGGAITGATCNARCPVQTYFIGYASYAINGRQNQKIGGYSGVSGLMDLKVSSSAVATRNPRLIMVVLDRSASMLEQGGGAVGLAPAVVQFLSFFDTSSDTIGIVSFGSGARLEMPMTTNFLIAGTNNLIDGYMTNTVTAGLNTPGLDPEAVSTNVNYQVNYATSGIRRLKFGGDTAADDGIRYGLEQMMANSGFNDPDVVKYLVIFTDGAWNASRTLFAAPGYTNEITCPGPFTGAAALTNLWVTNAAFAPTVVPPLTNGAPGAWDENLAADANILPVPSMGQNGTSLPFVTNAIAKMDVADSQGTAYPFEYYANDHTNDTWQSVDSSGDEPIGSPTSAVEGHTVKVINSTLVGRIPPAGAIPGTNYYTHDLDIWLPPGSIAYYYTNAASSAITSAYISDYTKPAKHIAFNLNSGGKIDLVVPGYITDGIWYDGLDMCYPDNSETVGSTTYPRYRSNNYQEGFMWPDDTNNTPLPEPYNAGSLQRELMFRNYANLLTGFYLIRPDDPLSDYYPSRPVGQQGIEPLITDATNATTGVVGAPRPKYGLGAYYPANGFYWPFGGDSDSQGYITNAVGLDWGPTYSLPNPTHDPDPNYSQGDIGDGFYNGGSRHAAYSINMLSTNATPEWFGELFYNSISGKGTSVTSGAQSASQIMHASDWQTGLPIFAQGLTVDMLSDTNHNAQIVGAPTVWRPATYNGVSYNGTSFVTTVNANGVPTITTSLTGGYVSDGNGHYYYNAMAYSGRPTHYYDFALSSWEPIQNNHQTNIQALPMGNWKATEYAWHARALGVTIYTVGYGTHVTAAQCLQLAQIANATNSISPGSPLVTNSHPFNPSQPIGQQFYATTAAQISNDFYSIGQAINAALTQ
jgi:hypothetical protein